MCLCSLQFDVVAYGGGTDVQYLHLPMNVAAWMGHKCCDLCFGRNACSLMWWHMGGMCWAAGYRAAAGVYQAPVWPPQSWLVPFACWQAWCLLLTGDPVPSSCCVNCPCCCCCWRKNCTAPRRELGWAPAWEDLHCECSTSVSAPFNADEASVETGFGAWIWWSYGTGQC